MGNTSTKLMTEHEKMLTHHFGKDDAAVMKVHQGRRYGVVAYVAASVVASVVAGVDDVTPQLRE